MSTEDMSHVYGALVINARSRVDRLPIFDHPATRTGDHSGTNHSQLFNTVFWTLALGPQLHTEVVALPQRNKYLTVDTVSESLHVSECVNMELGDKLSVIDAQFHGGRQLYKVYHVMRDTTKALDADFVTVINNEAEHSSFNLLSAGYTIDVYGVYDLVNSSVQLAWSTDEEFINLCRAREPTRYIFYRYPPLLDRPLFIYTQYIVSKFWHWSKAFGNNSSTLLKCFNALELFLYKDHTQAVDPRTMKSMYKLPDKNGNETS